MNSVSTKRWSAAHRRWIEVMDELFTSFVGKDYLTYEYSENLCCFVADDDHPILEYDSESWENIVKNKMNEREWLENETPCAWRLKKRRIPKKSRRKLFKSLKGKRNRGKSSVVSSSSPSSLNRKRKLDSAASPVSPRRKQSSTLDSAKLQKSSIPKTRRCLFLSSNRKRKQATPLKVPSAKRKLLTTPTPSYSNDLPSLSPTGINPLPSDTSGLLTSPPSDSASPPLDTSGLLSSLPRAASTPRTPSENASSQPCAISSTSFCSVFSATCPREVLLTSTLPPVDCGITVQQNRLVRVSDNFVFTNVARIKKRPPACVVQAAVKLLREEKKSSDEIGKQIDLEAEERETGIAIGQLGIFSRTGLGHLEWLGEVAKMQHNVKEEKKWMMESPDNLENGTREKILYILNKYPLNHLVAREGKCSVDVRAFSNLCLERYIDDSVIDTMIARLHSQSPFKESVLCLPAHTITWLNTGDEDFIQECFKEKLLNINPEMLRLVLVPVNMSDMHWGLMVIDVGSREAFFDDGLGWTFPKISLVHQILRQLHSLFQGCASFTFEQWCMVRSFKRFGMPRQPCGGQVVGSGS